MTFITSSFLRLSFRQPSLLSLSLACFHGLRTTSPLPSSPFPVYFHSSYQSKAHGGLPVNMPPGSPPLHPLILWEGLELGQRSGSGFMQLTVELSLVTPRYGSFKLSALLEALNSKSWSPAKRGRKMCDHTNTWNDVTISDLSENLPRGFWPSFKNLMDVTTWSLQKKANYVERCYLLNYLAG